MKMDVTTLDAGSSGSVDLPDHIFGIKDVRSDILHRMVRYQLAKLDNQRFPSAEQGLESLVKKPTVGSVPPNWKPYLDKLPNDPWGRAYQYVNPGVKGEIDIFSFGADGQPGGEGNDADVGSWQ